MKTCTLLFAIMLICFPTMAFADDLADEPNQEAISRTRVDGVDYGYIHSTAMWPTPSPQIPVCWENPSGDDTERGWVKSAVNSSWEAHSAVKFTGWQTCATVNRGIRIQIADKNPHVKRTGKNIDGFKNGMVLDFVFDQWSPTCATSESMRKSCIQSIAVHEFGQALGFAHEHNRLDRSSGCMKNPQGADGDMMLTPYDISSVMNYCNQTYNNNGILSVKDVASVTALYCLPNQPSCKPRV